MRTVRVMKGATYTEIANPPRTRIADYDIITLLEPGKQPVEVEGKRSYIFRLGQDLWMVDAQHVEEIHA